MALGREHHELFERYVAELRAALEIARRETRRDKAELLAAHPRVLGVVVEAFFECLRLNQAIEAVGGGEEVEPVVFVLEMLDGSHQDLWQALAALPYLPPGLTREDEWV